ncbi:MAG: terminase small subunit [Sedimenticola sp.]
MIEVRNQKLTNKQTQFAVAYVRTGGKGAESARQAGYAVDSADVTSYKLLRNPKVLEAIERETRKALKSDVALARQTIYDLCRNSSSDAVRLQAAQALLSHGGLQVVRQSEVRHTLEDNRTDQELIASIQSYLEELKIVPGEVVQEEVKPELIEQVTNKPGVGESAVPDWLKEVGSAS